MNLTWRLNTLTFILSFQFTITDEKDKTLESGKAKTTVKVYPSTKSKTRTVETIDVSQGTEK